MSCTVDVIYNLSNIMHTGLLERGRWWRRATQRAQLIALYLFGRRGPNIFPEVLRRLPEPFRDPGSMESILLSDSSRPPFSNKPLEGSLLKRVHWLRAKFRVTLHHYRTGAVHDSGIKFNSSPTQLKTVAKSESDPQTSESFTTAAFLRSKA